MADKRDGSDRACRCRRAGGGAGGPPALARCQRSGRPGIRAGASPAPRPRRLPALPGAGTWGMAPRLAVARMPGWPASLDHLVVGSTGVWVIHSWRRPWFARLRRPISPPSSRGGIARPPLGPRVEAAAVDQLLTASGARLHVRPLLCIHGGGGWRLGPQPSVQGVRLASLGQLPEAIRLGDGTRAQQGQVERVTARLLAVLGPAA
jgi:hypothetical protein